MNRKKTQETKDNSERQVPSVGGTTSNRTVFDVAKTLLSIVPRNVTTSGSNSNSSVNGNATLKGNGVAQPMSNQDFGNIFLNKK